MEAVQLVASDELDETAFRTALTENLSAGRFQLVVAVDEITAELKAIVEYLNRHLSETVTLVALELGYLPEGDREYLIPETYGAEIADRSSARRRSSWTEDDVAAAVDEIEDPAARDLVQRLLAHAKEQGATIRGGIGLWPSAGFYYRIGDKRPSVWSLYVKGSGPAVAVNLGSISRASEESALEVMDRLRRSEALKAKLDDLGEEAFKKPLEFPIADVLQSESEAAGALEAAISAAHPGDR